MALTMRWMAGTVCPVWQLAMWALLAVPGGLRATALDDLAPWQGGKTPEFRLPGLDGRMLSLADLKGKTVIVNFWATWCAPCVEEMPSIETLKSRLDPARFEVVAVNMSESRARIEAFLKKVPVSFPIVLDAQSETARAWQVRGVPTTFVIGPDGTIRYYHVGDLDWSDERIVTRIKGIR